MEREKREITTGVRVAVNNLLKNKKIPYACAISQNDYWDYIAKYKSEISMYLPVNYICMMHKRHKDIYVHCSTKGNIEKIVKQGYLEARDADRTNSLGRAVYTFPLRSGMYFLPYNAEKFAWMVFQSDAPHVHIVQTDDTPCCIGEADFHQDKVYIGDDYQVIHDAKEMERLCIDVFDWKYAKKEYFGIQENVDATYETFLDVLEVYNTPKEYR